jgi:glutamine cyclotransferase
MKKKILLVVAVLAFLAIPLFKSCNGGEDPVVDPDILTVEVQLLSPSNQQQFNAGDDVPVSIKIENSEVSNLEIYVNDKLHETNISPSNTSINIPTTNVKVGEMRIRLSYTDSKGNIKNDSRTVVLFSDIQPEYKTASIVKEFPHDPTSYTQGLEFYNGFLFEGTGQRGSSLIAEVDLTTGDIKRKFELDAAYFGEGISILNDTIYQLTYTSSVCKVYDLGFNEITEYNYNGQGWGLCNDGSSLIMSNGSSELVWRDPKSFNITKTLQVFDNNKEVVNLNELELINGNLYANIYTEKKIVEIDTATGKVLSYIDCNALVVDGQVPGADVLNGIAYDAKTEKLYMTGKLWPKLYEVNID